MAKKIPRNGAMDDEAIDDSFEEVQSISSELMASEDADAGAPAPTRQSRDGGIASVMTPDPALCTPGTTCIEAAQLMRDNDCGALPVVEGLDEPRPIGIVTDRDLVVRGIAEGYDMKDALVIDVMTAEPFSVPLDASIEEAARVMQEHKVRRIIVVDERGNCAGIVAQADLMREPGEHGERVVEKVSEPGEERRPTL